MVRYVPRGEGGVGNSSFLATGHPFVLLLVKWLAPVATIPDRHMPQFHGVAHAGV